MPLTFDMTLEELKYYTGTNPRPEDFDEFWDCGIREAETLGFDFDLVPADFQTPYADCYHMYFTGVGDARIHAKLACPKPGRFPGPQPAVLQFHGYTGHSGDWVEKLPYAAMGYTTVAMDCRGQGGLSEDKGGVIGNTLSGHIIRGLEDAPEKMLFRQIFLDTVVMARITASMPEVDDARIYATGQSQGGGLALACAALFPGIRRAAAVYPFLCDYKRVWEIDLALDAYLELKTFFRWFDPLHEREDVIFKRLGYIDVQHLCPRIRADVLMATALMDTVCPPSSQFAAYNRIESEKRMTIYPDFGHEDIPGLEDIVFDFITHGHP